MRNPSGNARPRTPGVKRLLPSLAAVLLLCWDAAAASRAIDETALAIAAERLEPKRPSVMASQATIRAAAAGIGYEPSADRMDEVARQLFTGLGVVAVPCWADYKSTAYCGVLPDAPVGHRTSIRRGAHEVDRASVDGLLPLAGWFRRGKVSWREYVMDGMQLSRVYLWGYVNESFYEVRIAVVFE